MITIKIKSGWILLFVIVLSINFTSAQNPKQLISEMIDSVGGKENFYQLGNVTYDYEYHNSDLPLHLASQETYAFDGEKSYAEYSLHSIMGANGEKIVDGYNGKEAWLKINGQLVTDEKPNFTARFLRKTNYYWFAMYFKLLDDGLNHEYLGSKKVDGKEYDLVKVTFDENIGDAQDTYVFYINKKTKLVDQFLFTVVGFGFSPEKPFLMKLNYETVNGIKIASKRKYIDADWDGNIVGKNWSTTDWTNIKFKNNIDDTLFEKPLE